MTLQVPRSVRQAMPLAREVVEHIAIDYGVCIRPVPMRRIDTHTGKSEIIDVPCGATLETKCPSCAKRNRQLRMAQCREGWHLETEPAITPDRAQRAISAAGRAARRPAGPAGCGRGGRRATPTTWTGDHRPGCRDQRRGHARQRPRPVRCRKRTRSTRRRQDAPDLPKRKRASTTLGRTFTAPDGKVYRPSLFVTLTLPSYGRVRDGVPVDPDELRLRAGRSGRAALLQAGRPVRAEPAPGGGLRRAVLRHRRTTAAARPAPAHGHPGHPAPRGDPADRRGHLPPGLVACGRPGRLRRRPPAGLG